MKTDKIILRVFIHKSKYSIDVEVPINITCNELVIALNNTYNLDFDTSDLSKCCLKCENPTALIRGIHTLKDYGLRNGSIIHIL